jgi:pilus assembly protein CpaB
MGAVRIIILVVAAIAALILTMIVGHLISHKPAPQVVAVAAPAKPVTRVVVAAHDLPIGETLIAADLAWQSWPADALNPAFITDGRSAAAPAQGVPAAVASQTSRVAADAVSAVTGAKSPMDALLGAIVKSPILANEPVTNAKLVRGGQGGYMAVVLRPGMRAIAVPISVNSDAGGFILPGDHVDVLQAHEADLPNSNGQKSYEAQTLLHNVRVLAIDQNAQEPKNGVQASVGSVATIEVSPRDAESVAAAKAQGEMILTLRAYTDAGGPSGGGARTVKVGTVRIIRNGQVSDVTVTP